MCVFAFPLQQQTATRGADPIPDCREEGQARSEGACEQAVLQAAASTPW